MGCGQKDCIIYLDPARQMPGLRVKRSCWARTARHAGCLCAAPILSQVAQRGPGDVPGAPSQGARCFIGTWAAWWRAGRSLPPGDCWQRSSRPSQVRAEAELTAPPPCATKSMDINSPALVLLRGMLPASPPPAPPGKVILGWRDDNRICICRLPSNFLVGASRKRTSCAVPLCSTSGDLEGDNHELLSGKTKKWKNSLGAAALSHCISRGPTVCVPPPGCQRDCLVYLKEPLTPHLIVRMCPSPNRFHLSVKRCHVHQAFLG